MSELDLAAASRRFLLTLELMEAGFALTRQRLRRENPEADEIELDRLFVAWLRASPELPPGMRQRSLGSISAA